MSVKKISLYFSEGSSDKEYHAEIAAFQDGYKVLFRYGRRGGTLAHGEKTSAPVTLPEAEKIFEKLKKEKMNKGYTEDISGAAYQGNEKAGLVSGETLTLLTKVDANTLRDLQDDPNYYFQQKVDGERRAIVRKDGELTGINKQNLVTPLPVEAVFGLSTLVDSSEFEGGDFAFDGELVGETYYVFDVLKIGGQAVRQQSFDARSRLLDTLFDGAQELSSHVVQVKTARSFAEKESLMTRINELNLEGVAIKHKWQSYDNAEQFKYKNYEECTVLVTGLNLGKRSVSIALVSKADGDTLVDVGNVTIPANVMIPAAGSFLEVKYLYAYEGGSLFQPVYHKPRPDVIEADDVASIKYKPSSQHIKAKM